MGRLINADTIVHYQTYDDEHEEFSEHESTIEDFLDEMTDEGCPNPVDAVPVVHGHWIKFGVSDKDGNHQYRCSVCECEEIHSPLVKVSYCWNCGARMDGKGGEQT